MDLSKNLLDICLDKNITIFCSWKNTLTAASFSKILLCYRDGIQFISRNGLEMFFDKYKQSTNLINPSPHYRKVIVKPASSCTFYFIANTFLCTFSCQIYKLIQKQLGNKYVVGKMPCWEKQLSQYPYPIP